MSFVRLGDDSTPSTSQGGTHVRRLLTSKAKFVAVLVCVLLFAIGLLSMSAFAVADSRGRFFVGTLICSSCLVTGVSIALGLVCRADFVDRSAPSATVV
jgi:hypothetical protein